ncbi:MAG: carbohydrate ABC transporter permease [Ferrimicrobium acidiphilum]
MALLKSNSRVGAALTASGSADGSGNGRVIVRRRLLITEPARVVIFVALLIISAVMFFPFVYMIANSFKTQAQYLQGSGFSTQSWHLLLRQMPIAREFVNSTIVAASAIVLILIVATSAGFAFAKLKFRYHYVIFIGIIGAMMVPVQSIIIPEYVNFARFGLINNYVSAVLTYTALGTPFATFLMTAFFRGLPDELIEAGLCDGLSYKGSFLRIALPMALPALATVAVLQFIQIWDDFLVALLFLQNPAVRTVTVGLGVLSSGRVVGIPVLMAGSLLSAIPAIIVYLFFQRYLVTGLTLGVSR